jgi:hypothetical protein
LHFFFFLSSVRYLPPFEQVLIGHIKKKMQKQKFPERCSLCAEVLPFSDFTRDTFSSTSWQRKHRVPSPVRRS